MHRSAAGPIRPFGSDWPGDRSSEEVRDGPSCEFCRGNQGAWAAYGFDWSTDKCSSSPDNPFGFPFANSCIRHDFGYRNYKAIGAFSANKARLDTMLLADLLRVCTRYSGVTRSACDSLAHTYYTAVHLFGTIAVSQADLDRAAAILDSGGVTV